MIQFEIKSSESSSPPPPPLHTITSSIGSSASESSGRGASGRSLSPSLFRSPNLRSNLTRTQVGRDPLFYYEVVKTLGVGSMGSVAKVRKRTNVVGGSARKEIQEAFRRQKEAKKCLDIPFFGWFFKFCIDGNLKQSESSLSSKNGSDRSNSKRGNGKTLEKQTSSRLRPAGLWLSESTTIDTNYEDDNDEDGEADGVDNLPDQPLTKGSHNNHANCYAMKSIHLSRVTDESFVSELKNEIDILKKLDHPHIVRAIETFEHKNQIFIVMELCEGGDLYSRDPYTEEETARVVSSVLNAVAYMHSRNVAHRDLKFENILFVNESRTSEVKLIDFGLSSVYGDHAQLTEGVGTIYTMAPEVLKGNYSSSADLWSIGVIAYMLLSSQMPFYGRKRRHIVEQILKCDYDFRGRRWKRISEPAKDFVRDLLVLDPDDRYTAQQASSAIWLNRRFAATTRAPYAEEEDGARLAMIRYAGYTKLKKMALMVIAHKSSSAEIGILRKLFQKFDSRRDGSISYEEFCEALATSGHSEEDLRNMFDAVDLDGSGRIRYTEFLAATIEAQGAISEERLAEAFDRIDSDDSGYISAENLAEMLGSDFPKEEIDAIIQEADLSNDNQVSYAEFLALWETKNEKERENALRELDDGLVRSESTSSLFEMNLSERVEIAGARANFLQAKHCTGTDNNAKHVVEFTENTIETRIT